MIELVDSNFGLELMATPIDFIKIAIMEEQKKLIWFSFEIIDYTEN